jgi:hypothetical protein
MPRHRNGPNPLPLPMAETETHADAKYDNKKQRMHVSNGEEPTHSTVISKC